LFFSLTKNPKHKYATIPYNRISHWQAAAMLAAVAAVV
jgi:hypothetical protein